MNKDKTPPVCQVILLGYFLHSVRLDERGRDEESEVAFRYIRTSCTGFIPLRPPPSFLSSFPPSLLSLPHTPLSTPSHLYHPLFLNTSRPPPCSLPSHSPSPSYLPTSFPPSISVSPPMVQGSNPCPPPPRQLLCVSRWSLARSRKD